MDRTTPLTEVAALLPKDGAAILSAVDDPGLQEDVLTSIRSILVYFETNGAVLDPVQAEMVMNALVVYLTTFTAMNDALSKRVQLLESRLQGAELLIKLMGERRLGSDG